MQIITVNLYKRHRKTNNAVHTISLPYSIEIMLQSYFY